MCARQVGAHSGGSVKKLFLFSLAWMLFGCGGESPSASVPTCDAVCSNLASRCGMAAPQCGTACASLSDETKRCIASAASCTSAESCLNAPAADAAMPDGGMSQVDAYAPNPNPCSRCTGQQYCVRDRGGVNPRCWDPPATCNGRPPADCDTCFYSAGIGPCASGARGCSSGGAGRTIDCM